MNRLLSGFLLVLATCAAYAQTSTADAPAEQASMLTVILFLVLFVGACVAFVAYTWWNGRKSKQEESLGNISRGSARS
jgi:flagellar basal body-associated protein FliL